MWYYRRWEKSVPEEVHHVGAEMMTSDLKHMLSFRPTERHKSWPMGFIHLLWRFPKAPWHHVGSFPGMTLSSQDGPESFDACRFDCRKWRVSVTPSPVQMSCVSRSWPSTNSGIGPSWDRFIRSGNHDAAGCSWAIKITFTPGDWAIFCSTCGTILNGGNAYRRPSRCPKAWTWHLSTLPWGTDTAIRTWWVFCWRMSQTSRSVARPTWQTRVVDSPWPSSIPWSVSGRLWTGNLPGCCALLADGREAT